MYSLSLPESKLSYERLLERCVGRWVERCVERHLGDEESATLASFLSDFDTYFLEVAAGFAFSTTSSSPELVRSIVPSFFFVAVSVEGALKCGFLVAVEVKPSSMLSTSESSLASSR